MRWRPYMLPSNTNDFINKFKTGEVPLVDEEIQKVLAGCKISITDTQMWEFSVNVTNPNNYKFNTGFTFSQQEGNCGGLWINRTHGNPQIFTYMIKNVMSMLGDNVAITSQWQKKLNVMKPFGWNEFLSVVGNRDGGANRINFAYLTLDKKQLAVHRFGNRNINTVKTDNPVVTGTKLSETILL